VFDYGPLGMPPLYGHGHAYALSLIVRLGAQDVLIDPRTYSYTGYPQWRRYLRGTRAHNTVTVDGQDLARQELSFMWSHAHSADLVHRTALGESGLIALARHSGQRALGVTHWRSVAACAPDTILVVDHLAGAGQHQLELNRHCAMRPVQNGPVFRLTTVTMNVVLRIGGGRTTVHRAEETPRR